MQADLGKKSMLQSLFADRDRTFDLNPTAQETRLPVHLVASEGTVSTANAQVHIHNK